jgi:hypothetical protein
MIAGRKLGYEFSPQPALPSKGLAEVRSRQKKPPSGGSWRVVTIKNC